MKRCPNCKRNVDDNSMFCEYCGCKIKKPRWPWLVLIAAVAIGIIVAVVISKNHEQQSIDRKEESLYRNCQSAADYRYYLSVYPEGQYAVMARNKVEELEQDSIRQQLDIKAAERNAYENCVSQRDCKAYLEKYPRGEYVSQVREKLDLMQQDSLNQLQMQNGANNYYEESNDSSGTTTEPSTTNNASTIDGINITVNGVSFVMKGVEGGSFSMGSGDADYKWENPVHNVTVSSFYIGETEVTQGLWKAVLGNNPSHFVGDNLPVDNVSYNDIVNEFLPKLNQLTGKNFRLPTEAEWEYAAKGGRSGGGYDYAGGNNIDKVAWYWQNTGDQFLRGSDDDWEWNKISNNKGRTRNVKGKSPNELGIYDMSGNVWEWCSDAWYQYKSNSENDPRHTGDAKSKRVLRGGSWCSRTTDCRVTFRSSREPDDRYDKRGFRLALGINR